MTAANVIAQNKNAIIERWIQKVKEEIPEARNHGVPMILNNVPGLLDALVDALDSDDAREVVYRSEIHGKERARETDYSLGQVLYEYRLLKGVIFIVLDEQGGKIESRERDGVMFAIDQAMGQATTAFFSERIREIEHARKEAEQLSRQLEEQGLFRDQFVATLSHDLRGPLSNTYQLVELLDEHLAGVDNVFVKSLLSKIRLSVDRGSQLISNLLDVSRIQAGKPLPIQREEKDLLPVIHTLLDSYQTATRNRIYLKSTQDEMINYWDTDALRRAISNLLSNALKYGADDEDIYLELRQDDDQSIIAVRNYGNPIPAEKLQKLFDPYYRAQDVKAQQGWGLGLTLVQGVAEAHGGRIEVSSHAEEGTVFSLLIPVNPQDA